MMRFRLSTLTWRWLVCSLALFSALLLAIEFSHAVRPLLIDGEHGSLGVVLVDQMGANNHGQGTHRLRIESLAPGSPLLAAGARPGDSLQFDRYEDRWCKFAPGEAVGLTLYQGGATRSLSLAAQAARISFAEYFDYWGRFLLALPARKLSARRVRSARLRRPPGRPRPACAAGRRARARSARPRAQGRPAKRGAAADGGAPPQRPQPGGTGGGGRRGRQCVRGARNDGGLGSKSIEQECQNPLYYIWLAPMAPSRTPRRRSLPFFAPVGVDG